MTEEKQISQYETVISDLVDVWSGALQYLEEFKAGKFKTRDDKYKRHNELIILRAAKYNKDRPSPFLVKDLKLRDLYRRAFATFKNIDRYVFDSEVFIQGNTRSIDDLRALSKEYLDDLKDKVEKELDALILEGNSISEPPKAPAAPNPLNITAGTVVLSVPPLQ